MESELLLEVFVLSHYFAKTGHTFSLDALKARTTNVFGRTICVDVNEHLL
jgi:hypothetical protein